MNRLRTMRRLLWIDALTILLTAAPAFAIDPSRRISQYEHRTWLTEEGLLRGRGSRVVQTADGYLWISTFKGLFRFDGNRLVPWQPGHGDVLPSSQIFTLTAARDGSLWIGTFEGLARLKEGRVTAFPTADGGVVRAIVETRDSTIWFTQLSNRAPTSGSVCQVVDEHVRCYGANEGLPLRGQTLVPDDRGGLWIGGDTALIRWTPGSHDTLLPRALQSNSNNEGIDALANATDGTLWVGVATAGEGLGLARVRDKHWTPFVAPSLDGSTLAVLALLVDQHGALWVGTKERGLYRIYGGNVDHFGRADGLSDDSVWSFCEDREGTLWISTSAGLDSLRDVDITSLSKQNGLSTTQVDSITASRDGGVWVGETGALDHLRDTIVTSVTFRKGLPGSQVAALLEDHLGRLWVGVDDGLFLYADRRFRRLTRRNGAPTGQVLGLTEDRDGVVWAEVAGTPRSLLQIRDQMVQAEFPAPEVPSARRVASDPRGGLWLGLVSGDLGHFDRGRTTTYPFTHDPEAYIFQLLPFDDGSVLAATSYGVIGRRRGQSVTLTTHNGLPCEPTYGIGAGSSGSLWLYSDCGLVEISQPDFDKWWSGASTSVTPHVLDVHDGARPGWTPFGAAAATTDGRLWFVNGEQLQMIDATAPRRRNRVAPPVHIEEVIADRMSYGPVNGLTLPAHTRDLEIDFTALSLRVPQRVSFRYRLEGRDPGWQGVGTRRQALYTDLRPGSYRFRVIASNDDGLWNETGAALTFTIAPAWYQTSLARFGGIALTLGTLWLLYRRRMRLVATTIAARFDERLLERTRIAQDLHDTFLQTLQGSKLVVDDALDPSTDSERMRHALERLSAFIGQAMQEGRAALNALRKSIVQTSDLAEDLRLVANGETRPTSTAVEVSVQGAARELHPIVRAEVCAIGCEAIRNGLRHSSARNVNVTIEYSRDLTVRVVDDGVGIDVPTLESGRDGHFGLKGMRERSARIGARLTISNLPKGGTDVMLVVPGSIIFKNAETLRQ